jgi:hypothetical protein
MTKFWEAMGGKLADRWAATGVAALVFWLGGFVAYAYSTHDIKNVADRVSRQPVVTQVGVIVLALAVIGASTVVVHRLVPIALAMLQGPWRGPFARLSMWRSTRVEARANQWDGQWQMLADIVQYGGTPEQRAEFARLDARLRRIPTPDVGYLPTPIGNTLLATNCVVTTKYGLDSGTVWPRLWLLFPQSARDELTAARAGLDASVAAVVWALAFCAFIPFTLWALPVGLLLAVVITWLWVPARVMTFAALVESTFDLYRHSLYTQLKLPLPSGPADEPAAGRRLTAYLYRGIAPPHTAFVEEKAK